MLNEQLQRPQVHLDIDELQLIFLEGLMTAVSNTGMSECSNRQLRDTVYTCMWQLLAQFKGNYHILQDSKTQALRMMLEDCSCEYSEVRNVSVILMWRIIFLLFHFTSTIQP